jgi:hypothetical protein
MTKLFSVMGMSYTTMNNSSNTMMRVEGRGNARGTHHQGSSRIKDKEEWGEEEGVVADCERRGRTVSSHHTGLTGVHHQVVAMVVEEGVLGMFQERSTLMNRMHRGKNPREQQSQQSRSATAA